MLRGSWSGIGTCQRFGSLLGLFLLGLALPLLAWCRAVSWEIGSGVIVVMYVCAVTCGQSFTVLSVWGV